MTDNLCFEVLDKTTNSPIVGATVTLIPSTSVGVISESGVYTTDTSGKACVTSYTCSSGQVIKQPYIVSVSGYKNSNGTVNRKCEAHASFNQTVKLTPVAVCNCASNEHCVNGVCIADTNYTLLWVILGVIAAVIVLILVL